jgi:hypothetical protein
MIVMLSHVFIYVVLKERLKPSTTRFNIKEFHILPTKHISVFCKNLRQNSNKFPLLISTKENERVHCTAQLNYLI